MFTAEDAEGAEENNIGLCVLSGLSGERLTFQ